MGVVLYVLVCGALPFDGRTLQSLRLRILSGQFGVPFFMSTECESLIKSMLAIDPLKRITIREIVEHRWIKIGGEDPEFDALIQESLSPGPDKPRIMNEPILTHMASMGMNREETIEVSAVDLLFPFADVVACRVSMKESSTTLVPFIIC